MAANGMYAHFFSPIVGSLHNAILLVRSGILDHLELFSFAPDGSTSNIFCDSAYPTSTHLQTGFKGAALSEQEMEFNRSMSAVRISVEWGLKRLLHILQQWILKTTLERFCYLLSGSIT